MPTCCHADEYSELFGGREARWRTWVFTRFGLHGSAATAAAMAGEAGDPEATLLEVGGGLGEIQVALLESERVASATNLDLSTGWEPAAARLLAQRDLGARVDRHVGDVVDDGDGLSPAHVVVAHRVLCCYPYWRRMADALAMLTLRRLVITLPVDRRRTRAAVGVGNWLMDRRGNDFRAFVHPIEPLLARFADRGLHVVADDAGIVWRTLAMEHDPGAAPGSNGAART